MISLQPGDYITAKCGRCNDTTGHVIMLILNGCITKVECKACGSVHKYRETREERAKRPQNESVRHVRAGQSREQAKDIERRPRSAAVPQSPSSRVSGGGRSSAKAEAAWQTAILNHSGESPLVYAMTSSFKARDFLEHPVFGKGEVISVAAPDKMDVLFECGVKTLRCKV